ncbi:MAG: hypothetical protein RUMPE_00458 [Eubacteriales bacterium SKADARSKE-1]|nr:hypothetical protein [Eubacteriales bacterium SKADARSKE-1]
MNKLYKLISTIFLSISILTTPFFMSNVKANSSTEAVYDPRGTYQSKLEPKSQIINGPCWAFASIASLETFLAKKNMLDGTLSEKHLLNWAHRGNNNPGWNCSISQGGAFRASDAYFTSGNGPVLSKEMPYNTNDNVFDKRRDNITPKYFIKGLKMVDSDIKSLKSAISEYGAVTAGYKFNDKFEHGISIIGWNNNLNKWLVKDSGSARGGYCWLPFSTKFYACYTFTDVERYDSKKKIYQHDEFGVYGAVNRLSNLCCANVYNFEKSETLDSIMINSESAGANYSLYYAPVSNDGTPNQNPSTWIKLGSGKIPYRGYSTCNLECKPELPEGKGAIILRLNSENDLQVLSVGYTSCDDKAIHIAPKANISYILSKGNFIDVNKLITSQKVSIHALSIKAITVKNSR